MQKKKSNDLENIAKTIQKEITTRSKNYTLKYTLAVVL